MAPELRFFGLLNPNLRSEAHLPARSGIDRDYLGRHAREHEDGGFDGVLVGASAEMADSLQIAAFAAAHTERLRFLVAHRPGPLHPTLAARQFATFDHLSEGRVTLHAISSRDGETAREGDSLTDKAARYERTEEHLRILKLVWTSNERFSFEGRHYRVEDYLSQVRTYQAPYIPISFAGDSPAAKRVGAALADQYSLYVQPLDDIRSEIAELNTLAATFERAAPLEITLTARLILGRTEAAAWQRAERLLDRVRTLSAYKGRENSANRLFDGAPSVGDQRLIDLDAKGGRHGGALFTRISGITGRGNSAALVGTPDRVADALLAYVDLGVRNIIIHGFEPHEDTVDYGRHIIPVLRQEARNRAHAAARERAAVAEAPARQDATADA